MTSFSRNSDVITCTAYCHNRFSKIFASFLLNPTLTSVTVPSSEYSNPGSECSTKSGKCSVCVANVLFTSLTLTLILTLTPTLTLPYRSLFVLMDSSGSLRILKGSYSSLWILIRPHGSLYVFMSLYRF